jgi:hypothetical protein
VRKKKPPLDESGTSTKPGSEPGARPTPEEKKPEPPATSLYEKSHLSEKLSHGSSEWKTLFEGFRRKNLHVRPTLLE